MALQRNLDLEYQNWLLTEKIEPCIDTKDLKELVTNELAFLRSLTVEEYSGVIILEMISCVTGVRMVMIKVMMRPVMNPSFHEITPWK